MWWVGIEAARTKIVREKEKKKQAKEVEMKLAEQHT
jgi:hypothetical protein